MSVEEVQAEIQRWYNGYQWEIGEPVYNRTGAPAV